MLTLNIDSIEKKSEALYHMCKDTVNYKILEGHKYEIRENPNREIESNSRLYMCKYDNWDKVFTKTWNLFCHFRVHTGEKPFKCNKWGKTFAQNSNLIKHRRIHSKPKNRKKVSNSWYFSWIFILIAFIRELIGSLLKWIDTLYRLLFKLTL